MPINLTLSAGTLYGFLLVLARVGSALVFVPLPGIRGAGEPARAALAIGFAMALSSALAKGGTPPEKLETSATVTFQPGEGITRGVLTVRGTVPGIDESAFKAAAEGAKENCPVSKALAGVPDVTVEATLAA